MADNHSKEVRSFNMSRIRSANTKPEIVVRSFLHRQGFRFRKNDKRFPGKPDIVLPKYKAIIFINGCFWHKHTCSKFVMPKSNVEYWENKLNNNVRRDKEHQKLLRDLGWRVFVLWECEINSERLIMLCDEIRREINGSD